MLLPWQRALNEAAEGRYDAPMPAYLSTERALAEQPLAQERQPQADGQLQPQHAERGQPPAPRPQSLAAPARRLP